MKLGKHAKLDLKPNADRSKSKAHLKSAFHFQRCSTSRAQRRDRGVKLGPIRSGMFVVSPFRFGVAHFGSAVLRVWWHLDAREPLAQLAAAMHDDVDSEISPLALLKPEIGE